MAFVNPPDTEIAALLNGAKTIALIWASANPARTSHEVMAFLQKKGHRVIPVNPGLAGQTLLGETVVARIADLPVKVDMADVFRPVEYIGGVVDECIAAGIPAVWTQLELVDEAAAERARAAPGRRGLRTSSVSAGMTVVMDRCPKIDYPRLGLRGPGVQPG